MLTQANRLAKLTVSPQRNIACSLDKINILSPDVTGDRDPPVMNFRCDSVTRSIHSLTVNPVCGNTPRNVVCSKCLNRIILRFALLLYALLKGSGLCIRVVWFYRHSTDCFRKTAAAHWSLDQKKNIETEEKVLWNQWVLNLLDDRHAKHKKIQKQIQTDRFDRITKHFLLQRLRFYFLNICPSVCLYFGLQTTLQTRIWTPNKSMECPNRLQNLLGDYTNITKTGTCHS